MKKILSVMTFISAISGLICAPSFAEDVSGLYINDMEIRYDISDDGRIQIPMRDLFETAGFTVQWFEAESRATAFNDDISITMIDGSNDIYVNKIEYTMQSPQGLENGEFMIDTETALTALDAEMEYRDGAVFIYSELAENTDSWQYEVFDMLNEIRRENGLDEFIWNADLEPVARAHGEDMVNRSYFSHDDPEGNTPFDRMRMNGIEYSFAAENLAAGQPSPESVVKAWMESDGHRENILSPDLKECAVAFVRGGKYGIYWINEFLTY